MWSTSLFLTLEYPIQINGRPTENSKNLNPKLKFLFQPKTQLSYNQALILQDIPQTNTFQVNKIKILKSIIQSMDFVLCILFYFDCLYSYFDFDKCQLKSLLKSIFIKSFDSFQKLSLLQILQISIQIENLSNKMRIISMHVLKWHQQNSFFITSAYQLGFASWYQRPFVKEQLNFGARTAANRSKIGQRIAISLPQAQAKCYLVIDKEGIAYAVLADDQYPERIVNLILRKLANDFKAQFQTAKFNKMEKDQNMTWKKLQENIKKYQDPKQVDKLQKLKGQLKEVEDICHKNMNDLLKRGEDLDNLMEKSKDVSKMSFDFYQTAKKANKRCCSLY